MVELFICGDIVNYKNHDGIICSEPLAAIILNADYSICNFEAPIEGKGSPILKSGPHHYQRKETINGLKQQGFDLLCLANNHIYDYGKKGLEETKKLAERSGLETIGAGVDFKEAYEPLIKEIKNIKVGFINACEAQFGVIDYSSNKEEAGYAWINHSEIDSRILELRDTCDFIIVLAHAGLEHYSIPQKEWRNRYKHLCSLGADIVIGSHPHVPQGYEQYKNSMIFYSLGNFYFDSEKYINKKDKSFSLLVNLSDDGTFSFNPVFHHKENMKVCLTPKENRIDLQLLNDNLEKNYEKFHDEMTLKVYNHLKRNLIYSLVPIPYDGTTLSSIKTLIKKLLGRSKEPNKNVLALHLIRNETYNYVFKRALEILSKEIRGKNDE